MRRDYRRYRLITSDNRQHFLGISPTNFTDQPSGPRKAVGLVRHRACVSV